MNYLKEYKWELFLLALAMFMFTLVAFADIGQDKAVFNSRLDQLVNRRAILLTELDKVEEQMIQYQAIVDYIEKLEVEQSTEDVQ